MFKGIPASLGIAIGKARLICKINIEIKETKTENIEAEIHRFTAALEIAKHQLQKIKIDALENIGSENASIFDAHILMLEDEELTASVINKITIDSCNAEYALNSIFDAYISLFEDMENEYIKERAMDIRDVRERLLGIMLQIDNTSNLNYVNEKSIIVTQELTPSDTAGMDKNNIIGIITKLGGSTSHSAIMARTLEIPAVVGVGANIDLIKNGDFLIIDGDSGFVIINPDEETVKTYNEKKNIIEKHKKELQIFKNNPTKTLDGKIYEIAANIGSPDDTSAALACGAEGIGLFRTEFLYMNSTSLPSEEDQFTAYRAALTKMKNKPVVIRTLDIGGDKKLPYLSIEEEMNPFLGYRAIRLCLDKKDIFITQLRALLRASIYGNLKIMFPMIANLEELTAAKTILENVKADLDYAGIPYSSNIEVGIMIEIPSAAIMTDILAKEVDFFSIGTNDLIQYTIAVDRMNEKVAYLYNPYNISVLRLIKLVIDNAHINNKWVGMCGEAAGDINLIPVLLGLGLDEFSMSSSSVLEARKLICSTTYEACRSLTDKVLALTSAITIKKCLEDFALELL
jgi:phosphoenolpyruvate-protein phosphotransferase (PTS system enzyme I)